MPQLRLIPRDQNNARSMIATLGYELDWTLLKVSKSGEPVENIWRTANNDTTVHYIEDNVIGLAYLVLVGENLNGTKSAILNKMTTITQQDGVRMYKSAQSVMEKIRGIYLITLTSTENENPLTLDILQRASKDTHEGVRHAVIVAAGYLGWEKLKNLLEGMSQGDNSASIRRDSALMLQALGSQR